MASEGTGGVERGVAGWAAGAFVECGGRWERESKC